MTAQFSKTMATLSMGLVFIVTFPNLALAGFVDVKTATPNSKAIIELQNRGIFSGYSDGTFRPNQSINRAELMKIIVQGALGITPNGNNCFPDVRTDWFAPFICYASSQEWVRGYPDGKFHPDQTLTQAEALKMIIVSVVPEGTVSTQGCASTDWFSPYLCQAEQLGITDSTSFNASKKMTRGLAAAWLFSALPQDSTSNEIPQKSSSSSASNEQTSVSSVSSSSTSYFLERVDYWKKFHEELLDAAKDLTRQGASAKDCLRVLSNLESTFVSRYNTDFLKSGDERGLLLVEQDFKAAPKICY